jgi:hypothetical protein
MSDIPIIPTTTTIEEDDYYATYFPDPTKTPHTDITPDTLHNEVVEEETISTPVIATTDEWLPSPPTEQSHTPLETSIVQQVYEEIGEDTKFVRLTTVTTIVHSIIFLLYIGFNAMRMMPHSSKENASMMKLIENLMTVFQWHVARWRVLLIGLILAIGYFIMPPIGEASMIYYLSATEKRGSISLAKWFWQFFPMFEYNGMISFFTILPYFIIVSRFFMLDLLENAFVLIILFLRWCIILFAYIFLPFTKFYIVQENCKPFDAMKKSMNLSLSNLGIVTKYTFLQYALSIRFIINILLFLGVPMIILYTATAFDITAPGLVWWIILVVSVAIGLLIAYINGIIEAFFITLWYRLFQQIK